MQPLGQSVASSTRRSLLLLLALALDPSLSGLDAQGIKPLAAGGVEVTPDGGSDPGRNPNAGYATTFVVRNTGTFQYVFMLACGRTGAVTFCESDLEQVTVPAGATRNVIVQYTTGTSGSGTVTLTASRTGMSDQGSVNVTVLPLGAQP